MGPQSSFRNSWSTLAQSFPPKTRFTADQVPDMTGRVVIVTGGNCGIGKEIIKVLLEHNAKVYMAARNKDKADVAIEELKAQTGKEAIFLELDLASLSSVRSAAEEFLKKETELHILFNNAGIMWTPVEQLTADGYDMQFGTNVIGHFLLTNLLLPALLTGTQTAPDGFARVIGSSSVTAYMYALNWDAVTCKDGPARRKMSTEDLYSQSKFACAVVSRQLAKRFGDKGIISVSLNPGNLQTELQRSITPYKRKILNAMLYPAPMGALTPLWCATSPDVLANNGEFFIPWARVGKCRKELYDDDLGNRLWEWLEAQIKGR